MVWIVFLYWSNAEVRTRILSNLPLTRLIQVKDRINKQLSTEFCAQNLFFLQFLQLGNFRHGMEP